MTLGSAPGTLRGARIKPRVSQLPVKALLHRAVSGNPLGFCLPTGDSAPFQACGVRESEFPPLALAAAPCFPSRVTGKVCPGPSGPLSRSQVTVFAQSRGHRPQLSLRDGLFISRSCGSQPTFSAPCPALTSQDPSVPEMQL